MADIKTRDAVKGTIKTIDKAAVASERMKAAYAKTKEKAEEGNTWMLSLVFNGLNVSWSIPNDPGRLLPGNSSGFAGFFDRLSNGHKIKVKIVVSFVHKLTTLQQYNVTFLLYRGHSSYETM